MKLNDLVSDYRKENERFVDKVSKLQQKLNINSHHSSAITGIGNKNDMLMKDRLESTTSYFSEENEAVREFAYGKMRNGGGMDCDDDDEEEGGLYDETDCFNHNMETPARSMM